MRVLTVLGTRPELIRLSAVIRKLDDTVDHVLLHTGQNFTPNLAGDFFSELGVRSADYQFEVGRASTAASQVGRVLEVTAEVIASTRPDKLLILGDTNSCMAAYAAKRAGVRVFHMEAGNRCFDDRVPEEINRRAVDSLSDVLMPYTERARTNLLREGFSPERIFVTGNPIYEIIEAARPTLDIEGACARFSLTPQSFVLVTMHRAENVDDPARLRAYLESLNTVGSTLSMPVLISVHPRLRSKLPEFDLPFLRPVDAFGFTDFLALESAAAIVLTDSGTVQEEAAILGVPNVSIRFANERQETLEHGRSLLVDPTRANLVDAVMALMTTDAPSTLPPEYTIPDVSSRVLRLLLSDL